MKPNRVELGRTPFAPTKALLPVSIEYVISVGCQVHRRDRSRPAKRGTLLKENNLREELLFWGYSVVFHENHFRETLLNM